MASEERRAVKVLRPTPKLASMFQYSSGLKFSISFFPVVDDPDGHALHTACRQAPADFPPEERAELIAHQTVQHAAGLLGVEEVFVNGAGWAMPSCTPFFVISSKVTRLLPWGSRPRILARCQLMASPSRSGSVARMTPSECLALLLSSFDELFLAL